MRTLELAVIFGIGALLTGCGAQSRAVAGDASSPDGGSEADASVAGDADAGAGGQPGAVVDPDAFPGVAEPTFVEVAAEAGIDIVQLEPGSHFGCRTAYGDDCPFSSTHMTGGAAAGDYDGDGLVDLYVTRLDAPGVLYRNRGDGSFEDVTASAELGEVLGGNGAAFGDLDGDGDLDLYVTNLTGNRHHLYMNDGGRFAEQAVQRGAATDTGARHEGFSVGFGDFDHDGWLDIHVNEWTNRDPASDEPNHTMLLRNRGHRRPAFFDDVTQAMGVHMLEGTRANRTGFVSTFTDLDGDGRMDLATVADFLSSRLFWGDAEEGAFIDGTIAARVGTDLNGMGSAIGDYDRDGDLDWFITSILDPNYTCDDVECSWGTDGNRLYRNDGARTFSDVTSEAGVRDGGWGWGASFLDYDNDGHLDLVMTNGVDFPNPSSAKFRDDPVKLWRNRGDGTFDEVATAVGIDDRVDGKGLLVLDYDGDGDLDVFIARHEAPPALFRNEGGDVNSWLRVELAGPLGNTRGIGARITVQRRDGELPQLREVRASGQFLGQNEVTAHFGLGSYEEPVHSVRVQWPDGGVSELHDVAPRQLLTIER